MSETLAAKRKHEAAVTQNNTEMGSIFLDLLLIRAFMGCNTTSAIYEKGKVALLKPIKKLKTVRRLAIFL